MALADLHVHSIHSEHPSEWFLQRIGAAESYTDPYDIYKNSKSNGMNFITITDHNRISGSLMLQLEYPETVFTSVESTVYFPEDGCKIHLLIYGLTERQFNDVQRLRKDIYQLRSYLMQENLACSVAHATYSVNNKISLAHLEKLILMFDVFEAINGGRNRLNNDIWTECLQSLTPDIIGDLYNKYNLEPMSDDPWIKGFTGGSDDHAGFFGAKTYTFAEANNIAEFLKEIKNKKSVAGGRHNDYKSLAFTIYKIAYDFSKTKSNKLSNPIITQITDSLFEKKRTAFIDKYSISKLFIKKKNNHDPLKKKLITSIEDIRNFKSQSSDEKFNFVYEKIADLGDEFFVQLSEKFVSNLKTGDLFNLLKDISLSLPGIFISMPFFTTMKHMFSGRDLLEQLQERFLSQSNPDKKILWFSDTVNDLNGVSFIVKRITSIACSKGKNIKLVACLNNEESTAEDLPAEYINLPYIYEFNLPHYESYLMRIPSVLKSMEIISQENPDEIYISTPGPVGLIALLIAKLMNIKATGVYHTDFKMQLDAIDEENGISDLTEAYTKWFYECMDSIKVPTAEYISLLSQRGFDSSKMSVFRRGIEEDLFYPLENAREILNKKYNLEEGFNLLYVGRISKDKNLDFMLNIYEILLQKYPKLNLIIAGDGPYLKTLKKNNLHLKRLIFADKVARENLNLLYSGSDLFFFPSNTDTFGMVVLEAQACGLPALVSDMGGPKEIVIDEQTGWVAKANDSYDWIQKTLSVINLFSDNNPEYQKYRNNSHKFTTEACNWDLVIEEILETKTDKSDKKLPSIPKW